jgi:hypothetical protein
MLELHKTKHETFKMVREHKEMTMALQNKLQRCLTWHMDMR